VLGASGAGDSYVHLPKGHNGWIPTNAVTFTMWVNPTGPQGAWTGLLCSRGGPQPGGVDFNDKGMLGYIWNDDSSWSFNSGLIVPADQWSFVAVAIEPTKATLYLNYIDATTGVTNYLSSVNPTPHKVQDLGTNEWRLATDFPGSRNLNGIIDEAAVFLRTLSSSEISALFGAGLGMNTVAPAISQTPAPKIVYAGRTVHFTGAASGTPSPTYQWQVRPAGSSEFSNLVDGDAVSGAKSAVLTLRNVATSQAGDYRLVASNPGGSASATATLTVLTVPTIGSYPKAVYSDGPVAYWRLSESYHQTNAVDFAGDLMGAYQTAALWGSDASGGGISGPTSPTFPGFEANNTAVQTTGDGVSASWVAVPTLPLSTNAATFLAWIKPAVDQEPDLAGILMIDANYREPGFCFTTGGQLGYRWNLDTTGTFESGLVPPANQWSMVALVIEPTMATLYLGTSGSLTNVVNPIPHVQEAAWGLGALIGCDGTQQSARTFQGVIDEVAMFDKALSSDQIDSLYRAAITQATPAPTLTVAPATAGKLAISWEGSGTLQSTAVLQGIGTAWTDLGSTNPMLVSPVGTAQFYRVRVP
jgi:Concanavalin A-like lectin/glucanases superfamily/Immunoglobulin I-set domain